VKLLETKALLEKANLHPKKSWGQNFLCDEEVLETIARAAHIGPEKPVIELGAGLGSLTHYLLACGGEVLAIERDRDLAPVLRTHFHNEKLQVIEANAATLDYAAYEKQLGQPLIVVGNLPYQLSGRILGSLGDGAAHICRAVLMIQKEVAERVVAEPDTSEYGLLTVLVQRAYVAEIICDVPRTAFYPPPRVDSAVIRLDVKPSLLSNDAAVVKIAKAAFSARRKTLRNALANGLQRPPSEVETLLVNNGFSPQARAENLSVADFVRLADVFVHG
jgi:16S rRNA (adenine1518-N6/adenine1519-N6)-dimethyltransferase